jgi:hypothetical protein
MANSNFIVQNGLTVGNTTIFAGNGDIITSGNIGSGGSGFSVPTQLTSTSQTANVGTLNVGGAINYGPDYGLIGSFVANIPAYSYVAVQNLSNTGNASASFTAYNNTGTSYIDMGVNSSSFNAVSSGFVNNSVNQPNASYVYAYGGEMVVGTWNNNGIHFITNAVTTAGDSMFIAGNGNVYISGNLTVSGNTTQINTITNFTTESANVISTAYLAGNAVTNSGTITLQNNMIPGGNVSINLGSSTAWYNNIYGTSTHALYADLAENYQADAYYEPGTVVEFGGVQEVTMGTADSKRVAGVVSTNPAHLMNGGLSGPNVVALALQGRVPCKVVGPVAQGDLMVSAGFGFAKVNNDAQAGQIIGKALQPVAFAGKAVIEVVVGRV